MSSLGVALDDLVRYYDEEEWKRYFQKLYDLYKVTAEVLKIHRQLVTLVGKSLSNLLDEKAYLEVFLGGFTANHEEPFDTYALARFYWDIYGVGISKNSARRLALELGKGKSFEEALAKVSVEMHHRTPQFIFFVEIMHNHLSKLIKELNKRYPDIKPISMTTIEIRDSKYGVEKVTELINKARAILPQYEPMSFFIWSLWSNVNYYAEEYYPKLWKDYVKNLLEKLGFEFKTHLRIGAIEVFGLRGIATSIMGIILSAFGITQLQDVIKYFDVSDEFSVYIRDAWNTIKQIEPEIMSFVNNYGQYLQSPDIIEFNLITYKYDYYDGFIRLRLPEEFTVYTNRSSSELKVVGYELKLRTSDWDIIGIAINPLKLLNTLAPMLMLRLANISGNGEKADWFIIVPRSIRD